ncbi:unnamed protein product [Blepharisma stoltei]|uniref:Proteasome alpha-type subunits domain-containing protein n=1 Tax=Blepharisma stoltei TaxID=1481888 RepID=A0AAU9JRC7_9CILI|nr:unnamed protein product [Blepharisma stoltei]
MSGAGTGYDLSSTTYNPEGKVYQVEYAMKAAENGGSIIGLKCKDGIVIGGERNVLSKMLVQNSNKCIFGITKNIGAVVTGVIPDGKAVISRARQEATQYAEFYGKDIGATVLAERVAQYMYLFTLYGGLRPFGCSIIMSGIDDGIPKLFLIEPSGAFFEYYACASGKGNQVCKTEIDKLNLADLTCRDAVYHIHKMLVKSREEGQEKRYEVDLSWLSQDANNFLVPVPLDFKDEMERKAKDDIEREERGD